MLKSVNPEDIESARAYDKMIPWKPRLQREIPLLTQVLPKGIILDVACATGRHSFELEKNGYKTVGIDISAAMIEVSRQNAKELNSKAEFHVTDAASENFHTELDPKPLAYDGAIMLGNAIANTESLYNAKKVLDNIMSVTKPDGVLVMQTIYRPEKPYYLPLRNTGEYMLQRIMIPVGREQEAEHNVELNVNVIDEMKYVNQSVANLYMLKNDEFKELAIQAGWQIEAIYSSYNKDPEKKQDGATAIWIMRRPALSISEQTKQIFNCSEEEIQKRAIEVWEQVKRIKPYRSMQNFKFIHPRVSDSPFLEELLKAEHILDVGCGVGADIRFLRLKGAKVDGLDITEDFMQIGEKLFGPHDGKLLVGELTGDIRTLKGKEIPEMNYNAIHAGSVIHLLENKEAFIKKMREIAPVFVGRTIASKEIASKEIASKETEKQSTIEEGEFYITSINELERMLRSAGYETIEIVPTKGMKRNSDRIHYEVYHILAK